MAAFPKVSSCGLVCKWCFWIVHYESSFMKNSFNITYACQNLLSLTAVICYSYYIIFRRLGSNYINLSKFKSRPCKQNEIWTKCKNSLIISFNLTYKINMDFIQRCIVFFKRLLILEVILLSLWLVIFKQ